MEEMIGRVIKGSYRVESMLGRGSMGIVYLATQVTLNRRVAIKVVDPNCASSREYTERFLFEARIASQLNHPNVVNVIDFGQEESGKLFLVMEYLEGELLSDFVPTGGLKHDKVAWVMEQVCAGVSAVHSVPIIHRDIKPNNIMVANLSGGGKIIKVLDFGICRAVDDAHTQLTQYGAIIGTPGYISPEQIHFESPITVKSDIYALGSLLYFLCTGDNPFSGSSAEILMAQQSAKPPKRIRTKDLNDKRCRGYWSAILTAMAYYPEDRYDTAESMALAVRQLSQSELPTITFDHFRLKQPGRVRPMLVASTIVSIAAGLIGLTSWWLWPQQSPLANAPTTEFAALEASVPDNSPSQSLTFGMSGDLSGTNAAVGQAVKAGIDARFREQNAAGGIRGQRLDLIALDDGYEPNRTIDNVHQLITQHDVLGFIGSIGTATTYAMLPEVMEHERLLFAPFTGAQIFRTEPPDRYVFNFRASYDQELDRLIQYLVDIKKFSPRNIGIFSPAKSASDSEKWSIADMMYRWLARYQFNPDETLLMHYDPASGDAGPALAMLKQHAEPIHAVIIIAPYQIAAEFIHGAQTQGSQAIFSALSFAGSEALIAELKHLQTPALEKVILTQVVPHLDSYSTSVLKFKDALQRFVPDTQPSAAALEGYLGASLLVEALLQTSGTITAEVIVNQLEKMHRVDLGTGSIIELAPSDHNASDKVWALGAITAGNLTELRYY